MSLNHSKKRLKHWLRQVILHWKRTVSNKIQNLDDLGPSIKIGRYTYGAHAQSILFARTSNPPKVSIGNFCSIAPGAVILANVDHPLNLPSTYPFRTLCSKSNQSLHHDNHDAITRGDTQIGHDVWIGQNAIVLSGLSIGTGAVIGAGTVVVKDIPAYAIAVGNPAKIVGYRFEPDIIDRLLDSHWWMLPDEAIKALDEYFYSSDIVAFLDKVKSLQ